MSEVRGQNSSGVRALQKAPLALTMRARRKKIALLTPYVYRAHMSNWNEIDPNLRLERIRIENYRNLTNIDVTIPDNVRVICLVGPNGSSKSALMSLVIDALYSLGTETLQEVSSSKRNHIPGITAQGYRSKISKSEIGPTGDAYCCRLDWRIKGDNQFSFFHYIHADHNTSSFSADLAKRFEVPGRTPPFFPSFQSGRRPLNIGDWYTTGWDSRTPTAQNDPIKKSVLLVRPVERHETPFYGKEDDQHTAPSFLTPEIDKRHWPVNIVKGIAQLEQFILDLYFEKIYTQKNSYDRFLQSIVGPLAELRQDLAHLQNDPNGSSAYFSKWPFRRFGIGRLRELSLLSAGELDILVTIGNIVAQQLFLINKFNAMDDDNAEPSGWVFIDEFDARLHPQWQEKLLSIIVKTFPHIRFMLTTHSPFVLRALPKEQSLILRLPDGQVFNDDFSSWSVEDILRVIFEVNPQWSKEITEELRKFENAVNTPELQADAVKLYFSLAERNEYLRSRCDRVLALMASAELRALIREAQVTKVASKS